MQLPEHSPAAQPNRQRSAFFSRNAAGAAIGDFAGRVEGAEIAAGRHIARLQLKTDSRRLQRPAADEILHRVITKQPQMSRAAARSDAGTNRNAAALHADFGERIEVRGCDLWTIRAGKIVKKDSYWKIRTSD